MSTGPDFRQTWLWRHSFENPRSDATIEEQEFFRRQYLALRDKAAQLVSRITVDIPGLTVHDIAHLDALWDTSSLVAEGAINVNPAEAYVFGASVLLHDSGMSLAAYPGGLDQVKETLAWKDSVARWALSSKEDGAIDSNPDSLSQLEIKAILPDVLRRLHAEQAEALTELKWKAQNGDHVFLIDDLDVRSFYGPTIGQIAHSHWWPVQRLEVEFQQDLGALSLHTRNIVDKVKLACLLRIADALHLDQWRAPRFLRTITHPSGHSALHWSFQERLARPHVELDAVVFTTGQLFDRGEAEAWWLAYDTLIAVDRELRDVDLLLQSRNREVFRARRVKGAGSPESLARTVQTKDWRPVDARLQASNVPRIVKNLGGSRLYGDDPTVALRELIQNAADAVQARRRFQRRPENWGLIAVSVERRNDGHWWLSVEDTGIGMSEQVLTGPLLDFGTSFWQSSMAMEEFPGLLSSGMRAIGRFGIGFFSVFMLGELVRVTSRRFDRGIETSRCLEFRDGTGARPILSVASSDTVPMDGGTKVEVRLTKEPWRTGGLLCNNFDPKSPLSLKRLVAAIAPNLDVEMTVNENSASNSVIQPGDWLRITEKALQYRLNPVLKEKKDEETSSSPSLIMPIAGESGEIYGRAFISTKRWWSLADGWITISGLRAQRLQNIEGILLGEAVTAARDTALPIATRYALSTWATEQARMISTRINDSRQQARTAEVVLECGGNICDLAIVEWGGEWLNTLQFAERLETTDEVLISFDGDFDYEEDSDDVLPRDFRDSFRTNEDVVVVLKYDGTIIPSSPSHWPRSLVGLDISDKSRVATYVRQIISRVWGDLHVESSEQREVGTVNGTEIEREVTVFRRPAAEDEDYDGEEG